MRNRKTTIVWLSRILAILGALIYLAVVIPSIMPLGWPANRQLTVEANGRNPFVLGTHIVVIGVTVTCIWVGQRRSQRVEVAGWGLLCGLLVLACVG